MEELKQKKDKLKEFGFFEIDKETRNKNFIMAREIDDIIIYYSEPYIKDNNIDIIVKIPSWID